MSAPAPPMTYRWDGENMVPLPRFARQADRQFVIGQAYQLAEWQERSSVSHTHQFAWLKDAWLNLPEHLADQFPTPEHLRKRALIDAGYYDEEILDIGTNEAAIRVATHLRAQDDFAHIVVRAGVVVIRTAKSQSARSMDRATFQASKTAILETVSQMIGVAPAALMKQSENA